jgi:hypothetical protein
MQRCGCWLSSLSACSWCGAVDASSQMATGVALMARNGGALLPTHHSLHSGSDQLANTARIADLLELVKKSRCRSTSTGSTLLRACTAVSRALGISGSCPDPVWAPARLPSASA